MATIIDQWINYFYHLIISILLSFLIFAIVLAGSLFYYFSLNNKNHNKTNTNSKQLSEASVKKVDPIASAQANDIAKAVASVEKQAGRELECESSIMEINDKNESNVRGILQKNSGLRARKSASNNISLDNPSGVSPSRGKKIQFFVNEEQVDDERKNAVEPASDGDPALAPTNNDLPTINSSPDEKVRLLLSTKAHNDSITAVSFSPDGWFLATAGGMKDRCVKVWTRSSLIHAEKDGLRKACTTPPRFTTIKLDSLDGPDCASSLSFPVGHATIIVVATQEKREVKGWKISKTPGALAKLEFAFKTTHAYVLSCADLYMGKALHFDDPSMFVITSSKGDTDVRVWSLRGDKIHSVETNDLVENVWVAPSGDRMAISNKNSIKIYDMQYKSGDAPILSKIKETSLVIDAPTQARDIAFEIGLDAYKIEKTATGNCQIATNNSGKAWALHHLPKDKTEIVTIAKSNGSDGSYSHLAVSPTRPVVLGVMEDKVDIYYASKQSGLGNLIATASNETGRKIRFIKVAPDGDCFITIDEDSREFLIFALPKGL